MMKRQETEDTFKELYEYAIKFDRVANLRDAVREVLMDTSLAETQQLSASTIQNKIISHVWKSVFPNDLAVAKRSPELRSPFEAKFALEMIRQAANDASLNIKELMRAISTNGVSYTAMRRQDDTSSAFGSRGSSQITTATTTTTTTTTVRDRGPKPKKYKGLDPPPTRSGCRAYQVLMPGTMPASHLRYGIGSAQTLLGCRLMLHEDPTRVEVGPAATQYRDGPAEIAEAIQHRVQMDAILALEDYVNASVSGGVAENLVSWLLKRYNAQTRRAEIDILKAHAEVSTKDVRRKGTRMDPDTRGVDAVIRDCVKRKGNRGGNARRGSFS